MLIGARVAADDISVIYMALLTECETSSLLGAINIAPLRGGWCVTCAAINMAPLRGGWCVNVRGYKHGTPLGAPRSKRTEQ